MIPIKEDPQMTSSIESIVKNMQTLAQAGALVNFSTKDFPNGQRFEHGGVVPKEGEETQEPAHHKPDILELILNTMQWPLVVSSAINGAVMPWVAVLNLSEFTVTDVYACMLASAILAGFSIGIAWMRGLLEGKLR